MRGVGRQLFAFTNVTDNVQIENEKSLIIRNFETENAELKKKHVATAARLMSRNRTRYRHRFLKWNFGCAPAESKLQLSVVPLYLQFYEANMGKGEISSKVLAYYRLYILDFSFYIQSIDCRLSQLAGSKLQKDLGEAFLHLLRHVLLTNQHWIKDSLPVHPYHLEKVSLHCLYRSLYNKNFLNSMLIWTEKKWSCIMCWRDIFQQHN